MPEYTVPYTFIAGTRAKASQVNANFEYVTEALQELDETKAELAGNAAVNFSVAEPTQLYHAVTKRYVDLAIANSGGSGGSGVGKSMFEIFHTLSTKTPSGAFSLRTGELILDAMNTYPAFWQALVEQGTGLIPDFTDVTTLPEGYSVNITDATLIDEDHKARAFSPYSWATASTAPSSQTPIVAELELKELTTCPYFRINSHVLDTYNSTGDANPGKAIKVASISVRQADDTWVPVVIINETEAPTTNERYYESSNPNLEFNAVRIVIAENFGANETDISLYPFDPNITSVRVVPEEQWQWEVENFNETGAFVLNETDQTIRLPKITRMLSGVSELWQVGVPESNEVSKSGLRWQEGNEPIETENASDLVSLDTVRAGLWIQVYNAVAEDAFSNIRYIPHAVLFEERPFRYLPDEATGWVVSDGNWRDGHYYSDAMTELLNEYASAVTPAGMNYKLSPKGFRFAEDSVYTSTYASYGEAPYYVVDPEGYRFKTPISDNYIRYTHTIDNTGDLLLDAAPNITGTVPGTEKSQMASGVTYDSPSGAFYTYGENVTNGSTENNVWDNDVFGFDASRANSVYGRASEVRPKSSYYLMCVFLGNEIPQSSSVDVLYRMKEQDERITALEETTSTSAEGLQKDVNELKTITEAQSVQINANATNIEVANTKIDNNSNQILAIQSDIGALQDKDELTDSELANITTKLNEMETQVEDAVEIVSSLDDRVSSNTSAIEGWVLEFDNLNAEIEKKSDLTYVDAELAKKQVTLHVSEDFNLDAEGNLSLKTSPVDSYTKGEVDDKLNAKADKTELADYATASSVTALSETVSALQTSINNISLWTGSQEEYDLIESKDANTLYIITG